MRACLLAEESVNPPTAINPGFNPQGMQQDIQIDDASRIHCRTPGTNVGPSPYCVVQPPSARMAAPVMNEASSEQR